MKLTAENVQFWGQWRAYSGGATTARQWHVHRHIYDGKGAENVLTLAGCVRF